MSDLTSTVIAVIGGTGKEGAGLAFRWANAGMPILIGSRDGARAAEKAAELNAELAAQGSPTHKPLQGMGNADAARAAQVVVISVPYDAHTSTLSALHDVLQGKVVIDVTVPMQPPDIRKVYVPEGKSACVEAQTILGRGAKVVAAFQNVSAAHLMHLDHAPACDVLVCGDDEAAKNTAITLVMAAGMRGIDAGALINAVAVEALTPVLLYINKKYKVKGAGITITGFAG
ncbi:MAG TPA: NADPH-dependent F420 reductase [Aggregatilineales bacterium]|mgnify:CR=1 FL=1|nr:NADPH-dependent F420 reductase [Aggregatilineales bacterium]